MHHPASSLNIRLQSALALARRGRPILPVYWSNGQQCGCGKSDCRSPAKHPIPYLAPRGVKHATTSLVVIRAWWSAAPRANPALATGVDSGLTVLDIDGDKGGYAALLNLEEANGPLPTTWRVKTASGEHVYFAYPDKHLSNTAGKLGPGLDIRCCGGYVVTVGATHRSGHIYTWMNGHRPDQAPVAHMPEWLLQPARQNLQPSSTERDSSRGYAFAALVSEERQLLATPIGQRNHRLNLAAFRLARFIVTGVLAEGDVRDVLLAAAARLGLSEREAQATISSSLRAGINSTRN
jgi:Bifunctional DNA primase/polymerase, N-terminal